MEGVWAMLLGQADAARDAAQRSLQLADERVNVRDIIRAKWLLGWARWHRAKGDVQPARDNAQEALAIADRSEYRLKQADIHNFLARLSLEEGNPEAARTHAETARERAWCDGLPHAYQPALDEAEQLLKELGQNPE